MTVLENAERIRDGYRIKREDKDLINQLKTCDIDGLLEAADMLSWSILEGTLWIYVPL